MSPVLLHIVQSIRFAQDFGMVFYRISADTGHFFGVVNGHPVMLARDFQNLPG